MSTKVSIPDANLTKAGAHTSAPVDVPADATVARLVVDRGAWGAKGVRACKAQAFISYDGGTTFDLLVGFTTEGGVVAGKTVSAVSRSIKPEKGVTRKVRVVMTCNIDMNTPVSVEFS